MITCDSLIELGHKDVLDAYRVTIWNGIQNVKVLGCYEDKNLDSSIWCICLIVTELQPIIVKWTELYITMQDALMQYQKLIMLEMNNLTTKMTALLKE